MAFIDLIKRIEEKSVEVGDCWIWQGAMNQHKLPITCYRGKTMSAQRAIAKHKHIMRDGLVAYAKCGNPACVNPEHVGVATKSERIKAGWAKVNKEVLARKISKSKAGRTGITDAIVSEIRLSNETTMELARRLELDKRTVSRIRLYKSRPDYTNPFRLL